ncbi:Hypothetical predicted protein [Mytilus galloprovincialis]|uniref:Uncharacterized protein n=1 Tax=Mytilus galloprovincialis TaxID=29158 RepID=A0A8B6DVY7_MYTGA|nr:Hypothetical predicted protein [Mytilus galloprovincialis]
MWGGKGDSSILVTGTRGFSKTSMYCCLVIQPQPLLSELCQLGGDDEEDKENETPNLNISLDESEMMTSKDTIHILRLAAVLHVFQHSFSCGLNDGCYTPTPLEITKSRLKQAMVLYNSLSQQKSLFVQAIASCDRDTPALHLKPVATFRDRVAKAMCKSCGPFVTIRQLQKRLKRSLAENIKSKFP